MYAQVTPTDPNSHNHTRLRGAAVINLLEPLITPSTQTTFFTHSRCQEDVSLSARRPSSCNGLGTDEPSNSVNLDVLEQGVRKLTGLQHAKFDPENRLLKRLYDPQIIEKYSPPEKLQVHAPCATLVE